MIPQPTPKKIPHFLSAIVVFVGLKGKKVSAVIKYCNNICKTDYFNTLQVMRRREGDTLIHKFNSEKMNAEGKCGYCLKMMER